MNRNEILQKVQEIFRDNFDNQELIINEETTALDIEEWDSLEQINLILLIEKEFNIKMDINETATLGSVREIIDIILKKCS